MHRSRARRTSSVGGAALALLCAGALLVVAPPQALAKTKKHEDLVRGFECSVEASWEQVPPKPGSDDLHIAAEWKDPSPSYQRFSGDQPTFRIIWTVQPKGDAPPPEVELPPWAKDLPEEQQEMLRAMRAGTRETLEGDVNRMLKWYERLFGPYKPIDEHYAARRKPDIIETRDDHEVDVVEINYHKKRPKNTDATWWLWVGRTSWETETEKVEVGFYGYADVEFAKDLRKQFERCVKTFELLEKEEPEAAASGGGAISEAEKKIQEFIRTKVIEGWTYERTPNYLVVYDEDVDKKIVNRVTKEIEALREQVYEVMFPPDKPIEAISIVRVCENRQQYSAYGAPGGSAGYWSPYHEELVLYQDRNDKKDAIRVLYHEAFHQYIFYSVGEISPHSWFNEGHGDFFSGHVYERGKFKPEIFRWRTETAREAKKRWEEGIYRMRGKGDPAATSDQERERLTLKEWLTWSQRQYYGGNDFEWAVRGDGSASPIPGGVNYALGWSFIYFLRTTRNEEYQRILPTYFNTLKSFVTQDREARERALEEGFGGATPPDEGGEPAGGEDGPTANGDSALPEGTTDVVPRDQWHDASLDKALRGIDWAQLEKDWLDHSW